MAERDLGRLLATIDPELQHGTYLFCTDADPQAEAVARLWFREPEGVTVVLPAEEAARLGVSGAHPCEWIVLRAASDLAAVGFLAAVTEALAGAGISVNAVSAFHHDHLFVPAGSGRDAVEVLRGLQRRHGG